MSRPSPLRAVPLLVMLALGGRAGAQPTFERPSRHTPTAEERAEIEAGIGELSKALEGLGAGVDADRRADVGAYLKAARWIVRHGEFFNPKYVGMTRQVLKTGLERAGHLAKGTSPWDRAEGSSIRGYVSAVDGSVQPYALILPPGYDPGAGPARLDVVLHGRGATLNEVSFIQSHDGKPAEKGQDGLVLHVFGRTNNAYRWAGEADVFEAIAAVKRRYPVDDRRLVLRGFSMGGAGAWHLGLHHPGLWCSVEAGAGFNESRRYARLKDLTPAQEKTLTIYDAVDYAANAFNVPMVGYGGEDDPQIQASKNIVEALKGLGVPMRQDGLITRAEGIPFLQVVGAKMGHKVDPASARILADFHDANAARGLDPSPARIRFVTYTLKYNRMAWLTVAALDEHYRRAEVEAQVDAGIVRIVRAENVAVLGIDRSAGGAVRFDGTDYPLAAGSPDALPSAYFRKSGGAWRPLDDREARAFVANAEGGKRHGLQGPIDDAFASPFLCVRGTGQPWNPKAQAWADARLARFADDWSQWLRGDLPIKDDTEVTPEDIAGRHLILFGDPGSNRLIARALDGLPLKWTRTEIDLGGRREPAADHAPTLIAPNPLNPGRYVVLNSGHSFDASAFRGTNALLYPRLGDYALFRLGSDGTGEPEASGLFDEHWRAPRDRTASDR